MSEELKPCPFCGSEADNFNPDGDMEGYNIRCSGKFALFNADESCCPMHTFSYGRYEDAVAAWNRRAQPERKLTDAEILALAAQHGIGWAEGGTVIPFAGDEDIAKDYLSFARALLAAQPAAATAPDGWKLVPDWKVGMRAMFHGFEYEIVAIGDKPGTFDLRLPSGIGDRWVNVPPDMLQPPAAQPAQDDGEKK